MYHVVAWLRLKTDCRGAIIVVLYSLRSPTRKSHGLFAEAKITLLLTAQTEAVNKLCNQVRRQTRSCVKLRIAESTSSTNASSFPNRLAWYHSMLVGRLGRAVQSELCMPKWD
jgi:hypothetical protein